MPAKVLEQLQVLFSSYQDYKKSVESPQFQLIELEKNLAEYTDVQDRVLKYIKPMHNWKPTITKIQKISNPSLEMKFNAAKTRCFGKYIALKCHGTGEDGIEKIPREGFKMPAPNGRRSMFGQGIYFATDSSKSAQEIYTKGTGKLLLCDVLLGNPKTVLSRDPSLTLEKIRGEGFDSVFAPRDSQATRGVLNDEFVIYDPDQALPRYIIHYKTGQDPMKELSSSSGGSDSDDDQERHRSEKKGLLP